MSRRDGRLNADLQRVFVRPCSNAKRRRLIRFPNTQDVSGTARFQTWAKPLKILRRCCRATSPKVTRDFAGIHRPLPPLSVATAPTPRTMCVGTTAGTGATLLRRTGFCRKGGKGFFQRITTAFGTLLRTGRQGARQIIKPFAAGFARIFVDWHVRALSKE